MSSPPTNAVSAFLLVDKRIQGYDKIVSSAKPDVRCIVFDTAEVDDVCKQQSITSFQYIANKIAELGVPSFSSIGIVQHNFKTPYHQFFGINPSEFSIVSSVETVDPTLQSWGGFATFISGLKTTYGLQNLDLMACALYSNPDWKYIIDTLEAQTGVTVRASTNDTGAAEFGGDWVLESHAGVNLKTVYFTDAIDEYLGLLDMLFMTALPAIGSYSNVAVAPSTLAVWGDSLTTTVLPASLSANLVNITKIFSYVNGTHHTIFALNTSGVLYGFSTKAFGTYTATNIVNVQSNSGWIDFFAYGSYIGLLKANGTVGFLTDTGDANGFIYNTTFSVSNAIAAYNFAAWNGDPNRMVGVLDSNSTLRTYQCPRNSGVTSTNGVQYTVTNVARVIVGRDRDYVVLKRDRTIGDPYNEITWTNVGIVYPLSNANIFGLDMSNNLLFQSVMNGYNYNNIGIINAPSSARTNVVTVKFTQNGSNRHGLLLQTNGNTTFWNSFGNNAQQADQAVAVYMSKGAWIIDRIIQASLKADGTLIIRGDAGNNTYSSQPVIDVVIGYNFIAFLLNNGNVVLHSSTNTFVNVVTTNNAVGLYLYGENQVNVILKDGSLVRYYNGSITYDTSVVTYNGSTTQSSTILSSNVAGVVATPGLQVAAIQTSSSLSSFTKMDLFSYFLSRNNRRINNFNSLNGTYTINDYRTLTLINPFLPTDKTYQLLIPDYQSSANLATTPYSVKSNITIDESVVNFIATIDEGEQFTINGETGTTYVLHSPFVYTVTTSPTFALTKVSTISAAGNVYTVYAEGGFSGIALPAPTLSNFGPFTVLNDRAYTLPTPTSNLATTYGSTWSEVGTIVGTGTNSYFGTYIAMSKDGTTIVAGAPQTTNPTKGYVGVYKNISGTWTRLGSLIYGDSQSDHFGESVAISADGTIIAVGAPQNNGFFAVGSGYVKVLKYVNTDWVQQGANITGAGSNYRNGGSISLSANGKIVAMGEMGHITNSVNLGRVRIFVYDESNTTVAPIGWTQLGGDMYGPAANSWFGRNVSLSSDGYTIAVSAPQYSTTSVLSGGGGAGGLVRIFQYSSTKVTNDTDVSSATFGPIGWNRVGGDFYGLASAQAGGFNGLNLSSDGTIIAIGYGSYISGGVSKGLARIFKYSASKTTNVTTESDANFGPIGWYRLGQDLLTSTADDSFGASVSLSNDGTVVSVCGLYLDNNPPTNNDNVGGVVSYSYSSSTNTWSSIGQTLYGLASWDTFGNSLRLSGNGAVLAISAPGGDISGGDTGYVKIYSIDVSGGFTYTSTDTSIAELYSSVLIPRGTGTAIVRAVQSGYGQYYTSKRISANVTVQPPVLPAPTYTYTVSKPQSITKTFGVDVSFSLTDLLTGVSNSVGAYTFSTASAAISISGSVATILAYTPSAITITASQDASGSYAAGTTAITLLVNRGTPTYQSVSQITKTYLTDVSFSLLSVMAGVSNSSGAYTFTSASSAISISGGVVTILASSGSTINILASQDASGNYNASSTTLSLVINRATPTFQSVAQIQKTVLTDVSFSLAPIVAGMSNSNGAYIFTPATNATGYITISGNIVSILAYTPTAVDIDVYQEASGNFTLKTGTISLLVARKVPSYGSFTPGTKTFGDASFSIVAPTTDNSGTAITYTSSAPSVATISSDGTVVTIIGHGSTTITASQAASGNYAAGSVTGVLTVNRAAPTFLKSFTISDKTFGDAPFSLLPFTEGLDNTDGTYSFSSSNPSIVSISNVDNVTATILAYSPTPITITVDIDACGNYAAATTSGTLTVNRANPTYQSVSQVSKTFGVDASFSLAAVMAGISNSSGAYTFSSTSDAISINGSVATILAYTPSAITITATQDASGNYNAGSKTFTLLVARGAPTYQSVSQVSKTFGVDASFSLAAVMAGVSNSSGAYTFSLLSGTTVLSTDNMNTITGGNQNGGQYQSNLKVSYSANLIGWDEAGYGTVCTVDISNTVGQTNTPNYVIMLWQDNVITQSTAVSSSNTNGKVYTVSFKAGPAVYQIANQATQATPNDGIIFELLRSNNTVLATSTYYPGAWAGYPTLTNSSFNYTGDGTGDVRLRIKSVSQTNGRFAGCVDDVVISSETSSSDLPTQLSINGDVATILGYTPNAVTIIATQDASGNYNSGSKTFSVLVARGAPTYQSVSQVSKTFGVDASFSLAAVMAGISNSSGAYTFSSSSAAVTVSGDVATIAAYTPSAITVTATQDASGNYNASSTSFSVLVARGTPTYQSVSQVSKTFGVDASFSLAAVMAGISNSSGAYTFSSSSAAVTISGDVATIASYTPSAITVTATQDASGNYNASSTSFSVLVARGAPTYQSVSQVSKTFGTDLSFSLTEIMNGVSNSDGAYTFSSASAAISISGDVVTILAYTESAITITASQDASGNYGAASTSIPLLVARATPTYQSVSQITKTFSTDVSFSLLAEPGVAGMSNSDGAYSLFSTTSDAISISGDVVTVLAYTPSPITITATQDASGNYTSSSNTLSLLINRGAPTYTPISQITKTFGTDVSFSLSPLVANLSLSNSSGAFTFSSTSDAISISGDVVSILAYTPSAVYITANQEASGNYTSGSTNNGISLLVNRKVPAYGAFTLPAVTYEDAPYSLVALNLVPTSESNATYTYSSSHPEVATVNSDGTVVTIVGQGTTTITASQDASGNYAAGSTTASLLVNRAAPTFLTAFTIPDKTFGDASFSLLPFTVGLDNTDGAYTFSSANTSVVSISGDYATVLAYSATPVTIYVAVDACGNYAASSTSGTLTINRAAPTYQSVSTVAKTFGDAPFSLSDVMIGISNSSGSYTFSSSDASAVSIGGDGVTATILAYSASAITITATQEASGNYASGTKTFSLTVARATPTIGTLSLGPLNGYYDVSDGYFTLTAPTSNSLGAFTYSSDNTSVAVISDPSIISTNLFARYDPSDPANYVLINGSIATIIDLTGNSRHLYQYGSVTNVVTVGSKQMLNCLNNAGFITSGQIPLSNTTLFMVVRYNPTNTSIPINGAFYQHGDRDNNLSIITGSSQSITLKSNNSDTANLTLVPNKSYILVSRVTGTLREFWAYSENGTYLGTYANDTNLNNVYSVMYIGISSNVTSCNSYIGETLLYNTALTNSDISNNIAVLQQKWFGVTNSAKTVRFLTSGNVNITATQDICGNYGTGSTSSLLRIGATVPTFGTFTMPTKTYGDGPFTLTPPSSNSDGAFTFSSSDTSVVSISGTTATIVGGSSTVITVTQDPSGSFTRKSTSVTFTVLPKNPNLRNFASVVRSYAASSVVMTPPESDSSGSFTYSSSNTSIATNTGGSANFTFLAGGTVTISATQAPTLNYAMNSISTTLTITPIAPTAFYANFNRPYNLGTFTIPAPTTSSNGTISYVSSDTSIATIDGSMVVIKKVGDTTITASIAATPTYLARDVSAIFSVVRGTPTMSGLSNQTVTMTQAPYTLSPTSNSTGTFSYVSDNSAVVFVTNGTTFNVASVGTANITATISEDASGNFNSRSLVFAITVIRATSNLATNGVFTVPALMTYGDAPVNAIQLPTSNSTGAITYVTGNSSVATIHPTTGVITAVGAGVVTFYATQAQTSVYNSNSKASNSIQILSKSVTQTRAEPYTSSTITKYYGDSMFTLGTVSESNASKLYSPSNTSVVTVSSNGSTANITIINVGSVVITAQQVSNSQYTTTNTLTWTLTVEKGNTALTGLAATLTKNVTNAPFTLSVSSPSTGVKSYALSDPNSSNVLTVNSSTGVVTLKSPGTATVVVSQAASSLYNAPADVSCVITVTEAGSALQGATITSSNVFDSVDMSGASLSGTTVSGSSFAGASLVNAVMTSATVTNSTMTSANLAGASMANANVSGTTFADATMTNVVMTSATVTNSTMTSANLAGASMANANVSGTTFAGATMTNVVMNSATVRNSTLTSVNLAGASMASADVSGTTFAGATMTSVVMTSATVRNSTLSSVNLTSASMANATITGTTFASSTMTNAVLTGATLTDSTLTSTNLTGASLASANVSGSSFVGATLTNADLSGATVTSADFTNANISGANITNVAFSPLQKIQLLKNTNNRTIGGIQVSDVSGSTILAAISQTSPAASIPNIADAVVKVVIPQTSTDPTAVISNVILDTVNSDKFYFPINEGEYFQISGVKYYTSEGVVKNYETDEVVEVISYGSKSIWLIAGSVFANVLDTNTISQSTFTVPSRKLDTDMPFNITVAPTSNSDAPIVYSSNHTSVATIHPTTGLITIVGQGHVRFTATQAATVMYEAGSKTSNELFVNKLVNFTLSGLNQTILMSTSGLLDASAVNLDNTDATAVFYVKVSDMANIFKFQTDSNDMNEVDASDVKYYVFNRKWPAELKINPAHAMMNKEESNGMLGTTDLFTGNKMLAKHDFLRYLALRLFNTIHGVDLFSNESDLLENTTYWGEDVNANIRSTLAAISTTSSDESMSYDVSGNKYLTNATTANTNLCRELVRQLTASAPSRFGSILDGNTPQSVPLMEDDTINFKVIFQSAPSQNVLTGVTEIPSRSYMVKLVLKNSINSMNTVVVDSEMYPNSYPYSSSVTTYAPTTASSTVYNSYSPPAPIPFSRFGFDGWYYTNSSAWVTSSSRNHVKWLLPANAGASSTVASLRYVRANLKIHNKTSMPFIIVYTQSGSWRKYAVPTTNSVVNGSTYSFYANFNSYTTAPATIGFTNQELVSSVGGGSFNSNEVILNIAIETSSTAATGTVDFTLASVVVGEATSEKEYGFEADVPASYP